MAILAGGVAAASIHDNKETPSPQAENGGGNPAAVGTDNEANNENEDASETSPAGEAARGDDGGIGADGAGGGVASSMPTGVLGEHKSGADGGEMWVEPPVVVKKYNKVCSRRKEYLESRRRCCLWVC